MEANLRDGLDQLPASLKSCLSLNAVEKPDVEAVTIGIFPLQDPGMVKTIRKG